MSDYNGSPFNYLYPTFDDTNQGPLVGKVNGIYPQINTSNQTSYASPWYQQQIQQQMQQRKSDSQFFSQFPGYIPSLLKIDDLAINPLSIQDSDINSSIKKLSEIDPVEVAHQTPQAQYTKVDISGNGMQKGIGIASSLISNGKNMYDQIKGGALGSTSGKAGFAGQAIAMTSDIAGSFIPEKTEYSGPKGDITQTLDTVYDGIADAAMSMGPWGMMVGGIMKGGALLGKGMNAIGAGTDGMTTTDAILGSSFFNLTPTGLINGIFGDRAQTITKDTQAFDQIGSSYAGTNYAVDEAVKKSGKKYGLFSMGALREANKEIAEAKAQQYNITNIANEARKRFDIQNSSMGVATNRRNMSLRGGYDQASVRVGKKGLKIDSISKAKNILKKYKEQQINQLQQGGKTDPFEYYLSTLPENQKDSTNFRVKDYWIFNDKPKDFNEALKRGMFVKGFDGVYHALSIAENPETGEIEYMKSANHPTRYMESDWYEKGIIYDEDGNQIQLKPGVQGYEDWIDFRNNYKLVKSNPYWKYVKRISKHKNGGSIIEICNTTIIEPVDLSLIEEFKNGGSINVIPDGALHARKHNMEIEGITKKGIPVVSENENGELEQQAEIEKEEIIYRIEVTQKLEELSKIYYNDNSTKEQKDEAALEAGKLLTRETLYNTVDNTKKLL